MRPMCRCFKLVRHGEPMVESNEPLREPVAGEVVVRIRAAGVCHSDVMLYDGFVDSGNGRKVDLSRGVAAPRVLGHEIAGEVTELGSGVTGVKVGDRVVVYPWIGCGKCKFCTSDREPLCSAPRNLGIHNDGGFSQYVFVPDARYCVPAGDMSYEQAAPYACSGLTAFGALKKLVPMHPTDSLLIVGAGGVGLSGIRFAKHVLGIAPIVAEPDQSKWPLAMEAGAARCIDSRDPTAMGPLMKSTGGGVSAAVDFVGTGDSFAFAFGALAKGGKLVSVGLIGGSTSITPAMIVFKTVTVQGSMVGTLGELTELLDIARQGLLPPLPVTTMPLDAANDAISKLHAGKLPGRAVLMP